MAGTGVKTAVQLSSEILLQIRCRCSKRRFAVQLLIVGRGGTLADGGSQRFHWTAEDCGAF
jgi:hypothetical protein